MTPDDPRDLPSKPSDRPDPSFIKRLEEDETFETRPPAAIRRTELRSDAHGNRRTDRRTARARHDEAYWDSSRTKQAAKQSRSTRVALIVLVAAMVVVLIVGLELGQSSAGSSTPFTLISLDMSGITGTTQVPAAGSSKTTTTSGSASSTTTAATATAGSSPSTTLAQ